MLKSANYRLSAISKLEELKKYVGIMEEAIENDDALTAYIISSTLESYSEHAVRAAVDLRERVAVGLALGIIESE